jgi:ornithine carbamoyltransferase
MPRHFLSLHDLTSAELAGLLQLGLDVKAHRARYAGALAGQTLAMIFQKSSTRTRVSFEVAMLQLGGHGLFLSGRDIQLGRGETISDTAQVLSRYVDGIMARTFAHQDVLDLARFGTVPVINGLTDDLHPCQVVADLLTIQEAFGELRGRKIAYVGDGNNVAHSLMFGAAKAGMDIAVASPAGYRVQEKYLELARADAAEAGTRIEITEDPLEAVRGASAVYTDVWASMGQEAESAERLRAFAGFQVDASMMAAAVPEAIFLHCLPCHRGEEVAAEVVDGPQSRVFDEAENRLHAQKAILLWLMGGVALPA